MKLNHIPNLVLIFSQGESIHRSLQLLLEDQVPANSLGWQARKFWQEARLLGSWVTTPSLPDLSLSPPSPDTSWSLTLGHHQADRMQEWNRFLRRVVNDTAIQSRVCHSKVSHLDMQHGLSRVVFQCVLPLTDFTGISRRPLCDHQCQGLLPIRQPLPSLLAPGIFHDVEGAAHCQGLSLK